MPEEKGGGGEPQKNAFGEDIKPKEEVDKTEQEAGGSGESDKGGEDKGGGDGKLTPTQQIAELSRKLGEYAEKERSWGETQKSKDENIRAMKESIKRLESQVGKKGESNSDDNKDEPLFKEIKTSKDLTDEQKEEMTDSEIKQMDEIATLKQTINTLAASIKKGAKGDGGDNNETTVDVNTTVRETAKELSNGNREMANLIIESFKSLKFSTEGLTEEDIAERVKIAATKVPNYKPPKEQANKGGKPAGGGTGTDPYGVDKVVDEVFKKSENNGFEL